MSSIPSETQEKIAKLSPQKQALLGLRLLQKVAGQGIIPRMPRNQGESIPLSFAQQRLWLLGQLTDNRAVYNMPMAFHLSGTLDMPALEASLNEILRRHESLRTVIGMQADRPVQLIGEASAIALPLADLAALPAERRQEALADLLREEASLAFDLGRDLLLRGKLFRMARDEHVLALTTHHIASDGWSRGILARELGLLYQAFLKGEPSPLPDLPIQYADYAAWQRGWLQGAELETQSAYWRQKLKGLSALELPTDRTRPKVQSFKGGLRSIQLSKTLVEALRGLGQAQNATLFMTLASAFLVLLHRYSGQDDIALGMPIAGRKTIELENMIGFFANTLVLRGNLSGDPSFLAFSEQVRLSALEAYSHQDLPFAKLVEELHPERDLSRSPLFQVMLVLQNAPSTDLELDNLSLRRLETETDTAKFDLSLLLSERGEGLEGFLEYASDLYDPETIERMIGHFQVLLEGIVARPQARLSELPLLTAAERRQVLVDWNASAADFPQDRCVHQLFEAQAAKTPDAVALVFEGQTLSYAELNARANRLARHLRGLGVGPDQAVGLCLERSFNLIVGVFAILKAGGAYAPLDPGYPGERLAFMLADTRAGVLLTQAGLAGRLPGFAGVKVLVDADWPAVAKHSPENLKVQQSPASLLYIIYTSGSTGQPKGIGMPHAALANLVHWQAGESRRQAALKTLQFASINFDVSAQEIFSTLSVGATLVMASDAVRHDPAELAGLLAEAGIERLFLPFVALNELAVHLAETRSMPARLREVITAGEQLQINAALRQLFAGLRHCSLHNQYGPSEAHVVTGLRLSGEPGAWPVLPSIGKPIANTQIYLLDRRLNPAPVGVPGELHIGGAGLARGYLNRPGLTAEKFIPNPFGPGRLYKSGDLARYLPGGDIEFLGRIDQQVKIRGFRIEPGEIEALLAQHPSVREAAVQVYEPAPGDKRLAAYVTAKTGAPPDLAQLREFLGGRLPEYMLPQSFTVLDALPSTPSGKLDRKALPAPGLPHSARGGDYAAPRNPAEASLAAIFAEVLGLDRVGVDDDFFALGGHSLLVMRVAARVRRRLGREISPRSLFQAPTVAGLAECLAAQAESAVSQDLPLLKSAAAGLAPLSFAQQSIWFLDRLLGPNAVYNMPWAMRLRGPLNATALQAALTGVCLRHAVLRTTLPAQHGEPAQYVRPPSAVDLAVFDLGGLGEAARACELGRRLQAEVETPFDLEQGPLLRACLLRLGGDEHVFVLNLHHSIADGWSLSVLARELSSLYQNALQGTAAALPEPPVQYADFARWQRQSLQGEDFQRLLDYWRRTLSGLEPLELPADRPRPAQASHRGGCHFFTLPAALTANLETLARRNGATLFMVLLAAFQALLQRHSRQDDIAVGTPTAGRAKPELEGLVGLFVNTLVLRTDLSGDPTFLELLGRVRETALGAYAHEAMPIEKLVEALNPQRDLARQALFQAMFVLQNTPESHWHWPGLDVEPLNLHTGTAKRDLLMELFPVPEGLAGMLEYATDLFDAETIERMAGHFQILLEGVAARPQARLSELPLLTQAERRQILADWNATATDYPKGFCVHQLFEAQVEKAPDAVALVFEGQTLTYAELNARANQLAHYLKTLGVGLETLVGVCLERSFDLIIALLGILKAGGAYVPLDADYPPKRLAFMLEDTKAQVLLTQRALLDRLPKYAGARVLLDGDSPAIARNSPANPLCQGSPDSLAYIIYTSGSAGVPKGAEIPHRGIARLVLGQDYARLDASQTFLLLAPLAFDASTLEIWGALLNGARCVLHPPGPLNLDALGESLRKHRVSVLWLTSTLFNTLIDQRPALLEGVAQILAGGEALSPSHVRRALESLPGVRLVNGYGPTESTTFTCCKTLDLALLQGLQSVPIGKPIANTQVYILDPHLNPVPVGVPGELHIGGDGLARGYLNRPELTAEKFIPNPFGPGRLYKSGDLARHLPGGDIEFLGRIDHQVKIRGFRIELGEIEAVLAQHPAVRQAVVQVYQPAPWDKRLVAYLAEKGGARPEPAGLREFLRASLPDYMLPAAFVFLDAMPLTANGKLDLKALPAPAQEAESSIEDDDRPQGALELQMVRLWEHLLGVSRIGVRDNFFELGGHSLLAVALLARIEQLFGRKLPLDSLWRQGGSIESLLAALREEGTQGLWDQAVPIQPKGARRPLFCAPVAGGHLYHWDNVARHLGQDQPVYGLPAKGTDGGQLADDSIEAMAGHAVGLMRAVQPRGPYRLAGFCSGGLVAFEMARQLLAAGESVECLALVDSLPPAQGAGLIVEIAKSSLQPNHWSHVKERLSQKFYHTLRLPVPKASMSMTSIHRWALWAYRPAPLEVDAVLFQPADDSAMAQAPTRWANLVAGRLAVRALPGKHEDLTREPGVRQLAESLGQHILQTETHPDKMGEVVLSEWIDRSSPNGPVNTKVE